MSEFLAILLLGALFAVFSLVRETRRGQPASGPDQPAACEGCPLSGVTQSRSARECRPGEQRAVSVEHSSDVGERGLCGPACPPR